MNLLHSLSLTVTTDTLLHPSSSSTSFIDTPGLMTSSSTSSIVDLSHTSQPLLPPIVIPATPTKPYKVDGFMLFCADQMSSSLPVKATPVLYERWNALPQERKKPYHHQAIIVNTKSEEGENDNHHSQITYVATSRSYTAPPPRQLVSPEAIRSAELEEKEEALGQQPFSAYSSFLSMKYSHEQHRSIHDDITSTSLIPADQSPTLTRSSSSSPSPTSSSFRNYLNLPSASTSASSSTSTSMTSSNFLPPPMLQQSHSQKQYDTRYLSDQYHPQQYGQQNTIPDDKSQVIPSSTCAPTKNMYTTTGFSQLQDIKTSTMTTTLDTMTALKTIYDKPTFSTSRRKRSGSTTSTTFERLKRPPNAYLLFNRDMRRKLLAVDPKLTVSEISKEIGERWKILSHDERQHYTEAAQALKTDHLKNHPDFIYTRRSKAELAEAKRTAKGGRKKLAVEPAAALNSLHLQQQQQQQQPSSTSTSSTPPLYFQGRFPLDSTDQPLPYDSNASSNSTASQSVITLSSNQTIITPITNGKRAMIKSEEPPVTGKKRGRRRSENGQRDPRGRKKKRHKYPTAPKHPMSGFLFFLGAVRPEVAQQFPGSTVGPISKEISSRWKNMSIKEREPWLLKAESDKARYAQEMQVYMANLKQQEAAAAAAAAAASTSVEAAVTSPTATPNMDLGHGNNNWENINRNQHMPRAISHNDDDDDVDVAGDDDDDDDDVDVDDQVIATVVQMVNSGNNGPSTLSSGTHLPSTPPPSYSYSSSSPYSIIPLSNNSSLSSSTSVYNSPLPLNNKPSNIVPL